MKIHELAQKTGLTPATIRFYEKEGLLDHRHVRRQENNYRDYSNEAVEHLQTIKRLQAAGFTLSELRKYTIADTKNKLVLQNIVELISEKVAEIDRKKAELEHTQALLERILAHKIRQLNEK